MPTLDDSLNLTIEDDGSFTLVVSDQGVAIPATHASTHGSAGADPITIANTQVTGLGTMSTQPANNITVTGGTIAGVTISTSTLSSPTINTPTIAGGTINSTVIGGTTPAAGTFTAVAGTTGMFSGAVSGTTGTFSGNTSVGGTLIVTGAVTLTTDLTVPNGGTGASTLTGIIRGNGTSAFTTVTSSTVGQVLRCTGANTFAFGAVDLADTDAVTGTLPVARGGTGGASESAARTALDVPATNSTIRWRSDITAFNGGASNALDSIDISNVTTWPTNACVAFVVSGDLVVYRLTATGAGESSPNIIVPDMAYASREWTLVSLLESNVAITGGTITGITDLAVADGGTGASTLTGTLTGNGTSAVTAATSSTVGQVLRCTGTNTFAYGAVDLADADAVTGSLPIANGGTGAAAPGAARTALGFGSGHATLGVGGFVTITDASVSGTSVVVATHHTSTGPTGHLYVDNSTPGEFTIYSTSGGDENDVDYIIIY